MIEHARRGMGYLLICGSHPGAPLGIGMGSALSAMAIASADTLPQLLAGLAVAAVFPLMMLTGAVSRSRTEDSFASVGKA